jgi:hypothetical protein
VQTETVTVNLNGPNPAPKKLSDVTESRKIDPATAALWLEKFAFDGQRKLSAQRLANIVDQIQRGHLTDATEITIGRLAGKDYLLNGQHRLNAIVQTGETVEQRVRWVEFETDAAMERLYASVDPRSAVREYGIAYKILAPHDAPDFTNRFRERLASAAAYISADFAHHKVSRTASVRWELARPWIPAARVYAACLEGSGNRSWSKLTTAPVMAVALITCQYQEDCARAFWTRLAANDGLKPGQPEHTLHKWLADNPVVVSSLYSRVLRATVQAWNAAFEGSTRQYLRVPDPTAPFAVMGTAVKYPRKEV